MTEARSKLLALATRFENAFALGGILERENKAVAHALRVLVEIHKQVDGAGNCCECGDGWPCPILVKAAEGL